MTEKKVVLTYDGLKNMEAELENPVFSKLGDLWCLGPHRVICGDSTGEEIVSA